MEMQQSWFILIVTLCISFLIKSLFNLLFPCNSTKKLTGKLPPGPPTFTTIHNFLQYRKPFFELPPILSTVRQKYGPLFTLKIGSQPTIFIANNTLAYQALVQKGGIFCGRPTKLSNQIFHNKRKGISTADYGPTWRALRRNLTSELLHSSRINSYSHVRKRVLENLVDGLKQDYKPDEGVRVLEHLRHAILCLLVRMCFGDDINENQIREIDYVRSFPRSKMFSICPKLAKIVFRNRHKELLEMLRNQEEVFMALVKARKKVKQEKLSTMKDGEDKKGKGFEFVSYVDTLLDLQVPDEDDTLQEGDVVSLCVEFLIAGNDAMTTTLQWIMANIVKYQHIQAKLFNEIKGVVAQGEYEVKEDDLQKMPYLKAVVLESLRRHPPSYLTATPHVAMEDAELDGYVVPKNTAVNFLIAEIGWDPNVWENPMEFKPERFLSRDDNGGDQEFDITGSREVKMIPFGAGRRICPAFGFALFHLQYFVANLVWHFQWSSANGEDVDLTEKLEFTSVMKNPLRADIFPRIK